MGGGRCGGYGHPVWTLLKREIHCPGHHERDWAKGQRYKPKRAGQQA